MIHQKDHFMVRIQNNSLISVLMVIFQDSKLPMFISFSGCHFTLVLTLILWHMYDGSNPSTLLQSKTAFFSSSRIQHVCENDIVLLFLSLKSCKRVIYTRILAVRSIRVGHLIKSLIKLPPSISIHISGTMTSTYSDIKSIFS